MKIASYIWRVLINLIQIGVILAILNSNYSPYEHLVITALVLIYISIVSFYSFYGITNYENLLFGAKQTVLIINKLVKNKEEEELSDFSAEQEKLDTALIKFWINAGFIYIIYLACLYNVFIALDNL